MKVLKAQLRAKSRGFSDVLYLDSATKTNLEEVSSCNVFIAKVFFQLFAILVGWINMETLAEHIRLSQLVELVYSASCTFQFDEIYCV